MRGLTARPCMFRGRELGERLAPTYNEQLLRRVGNAVTLKVSRGW